MSARFHGKAERTGVGGGASNHSQCLSLHGKPLKLSREPRSKSGEACGSLPPHLSGVCSLEKEGTETKTEKEQSKTLRDQLVKTVEHCGEMAGLRLVFQMATIG